MSDPWKEVLRTDYWTFLRGKLMCQEIVDDLFQGIDGYSLVTPPLQQKIAKAPAGNWEANMLYLNHLRDCGTEKTFACFVQVLRNTSGRYATHGEAVTKMENDPVLGPLTKTLIKTDKTVGMVVSDKSTPVGNPSHPDPSKPAKESRVRDYPKYQAKVRKYFKNMVDWQSIMINLGIQQNKCETTLRSKLGNANEACMDVLEFWIQLNVKGSKGTWQELLEALREGDQNGVAEDIEKDIQFV